MGAGFLAGYGRRDLQPHQRDPVWPCDLNPCQGWMNERTEEQKEEEERANGTGGCGHFGSEEEGCGGVGVLRPLALPRRAWQTSQHRP